MRAVGALAHYLEGDGLPTTQISLVREHTAKITPPRALWVPFEWGRPLGVSGNANFQTRVLRAALQLLEAPSGAVFVDCPEDAPPVADNATPLACPVNFASLPEELSAADLMQATLQREIGPLRTWYDLAVSTRGRMTVGISRLIPEEMGTCSGALLSLALYSESFFMAIVVAYHELNCEPQGSILRSE